MRTRKEQVRDQIREWAAAGQTHVPICAMCGSVVIPGDQVTLYVDQEQDEVAMACLACYPVPQG